MNHELVMLRGIDFCKHAVKQLNKECVLLALRSFSAENYKDGTLGQVQALARVAMERDKFQEYMDKVKQALLYMPRGYRSLIVAVYVMHVSKQELCTRYNVSLSTVYRKLTKARHCFRKKLQLLGCTEQWFRQNFGDADWVNTMLAAQHNGSRMAI